MSNRNRHRFWGAAIALCVTSLAVAAHAAWTLIDTPSIEFLAVGTAGLKINGSSRALTATDADGVLTLTAALTDMKTGIGMRDGHVRKYLETAKYPTATLVVLKSALSIPDDQATATANANGQFTIHGVTRPLGFEYRARRLGSDYLVQGKFKINLGDYKIEQPCFLGVCVDNEIKVKATFKLRDQ